MDYRTKPRGIRRWAASLFVVWLVCMCLDQIAQASNFEAGISFMTIATAGGEPLAVYRLGGRLHPLLVHFPIALVLTALAIEFLGLIRRHPKPSTTAMICLLLGIVFAGLSIASGLANHEFESHGRLVEDTIQWHKWLGIATGSMGALALLLGGVSLVFAAASVKPFYFFALFCSGALVGITGHFGGSIVYGGGYLSSIIWPEKEPPSALDPPSTNVVLSQNANDSAQSPATVFFATDIKPIFESRCANCHGESRQRGQLRLDRFTAIFAAEQSDWVVQPYNPDASELFRRVTLPAGHEDAMPPKGERLSNDQIAGIRRWIDEGAHEQPIRATTQPHLQEDRQEPRTFDNDPVLSGETAVQTRLPRPDVDWASIRSHDPEDTAQALTRLRESGAIAKRVFQGSDAMEVGFNLLGDHVSNDHLALLDGLESTLVWLNLADTSITDDGLVSLSAFSELRRVHLQRTNITNDGIEAIGALPEVHYLNLYGTQIDDAALPMLMEWPKLRDLYLWESGATLEGVRQFRQARPDVNVVYPVNTAPVQNKPTESESDAPG